MLKITIISLIVIISSEEYELKKIYSSTLNCYDLFKSIVEFKNNSTMYNGRYIAGYICEKGEI